MSEAQAEIKTEVAAEEIVVSTELKNIIEALIFASDEPMTVRFIRSIMDDVNKDLPPAQHYVVNADIIRKAVGDLNRGYGRMGSGFRIIEIAGGFVHATQEQFSSWVGKLAKEKARRRLSPTAVETLAIIAYKQPIAKGEVEFIRGVNVDYIINALLEKDLIQITGRANTPGRPLLYGTTQKFLEHFGLNELSDLPKPREISELINETELEVDRRILAEQQELEFKEDLEKKLEGNEGTKNKPVKGGKIKVPEEIKTENRRAEQQNETAAAVPIEDKKSDGQQNAEGEISSENNLAIDEATVQTKDVPAVAMSAPEIPATSAPEHSETNVQENLIQSSEHSEENREALPVLSRELPVPEPIEDVPEIQPTHDQVLSATSVPESSAENLATDSENRELPAEENDRRAAMEDVEVPSEHSSENEPQDREQQSENQSGTGWSKWKNKVKTFFRKLFA